MKVKGKCLNNFLGIVKVDMARLAVEGFPQELNKQLTALTLLPRYDIVWFDVQIHQRVATLKANFFVGYNLGHNYFKIGFLCLIGIAHLTDSMASLNFQHSIELRPTLSTDIGQQIEEELLGKVPEKGLKFTKNLFTAIRKVAALVLHRIPICGNIEYQKEEIKDDPVVTGKKKKFVTIDTSSVCDEHEIEEVKINGNDMLVS